jgi:hypothetical protein
MKVDHHEVVEKELQKRQNRQQKQDLHQQHQTKTSQMERISYHNMAQSLHSNLTTLSTTTAYPKEKAREEDS